MRPRKGSRLWTKSQSRPRSRLLLGVAYRAQQLNPTDAKQTNSGYRSRLVLIAFMAVRADWQTITPFQTDF